MNTLLSYISDNYIPGEPFLLENIEINIRYANLCQQMKTLVDEGLICLERRIWFNLRGGVERYRTGSQEDSRPVGLNMGKILSCCSRV